MQSLDVSSGGLAVSSDSTGKTLVWTLNNGEIRVSLLTWLETSLCFSIYICIIYPDQTAESFHFRKFFSLLAGAYRPLRGCVYSAVLPFRGCDFDRGSGHAA